MTQLWHCETKFFSKKWAFSKNVSGIPLGGHHQCRWFITLAVNFYAFGYCFDLLISEQINR